MIREDASMRRNRSGLYQPAPCALYIPHLDFLAIAFPGAGMAEERLIRNYNIEAGLDKLIPQRILFWDETLRDGEQTPGV